MAEVEAEFKYTELINSVMTEILADIDRAYPSNALNHDRCHSVLQRIKGRTQTLQTLNALIKVKVR